MCGEKRHRISRVTNRHNSDKVSWKRTIIICIVALVFSSFLKSLTECEEETCEEETSEEETREEETSEEETREEETREKETREEETREEETREEETRKKETSEEKICEEEICEEETSEEETCEEETSEEETCEEGCSVQINNDLPEPQPLLLIPGGSKDGYGFFLPESADGTIRFSCGEKVLLACPGSGNGFSNTKVGDRTAIATCASDNKFDVNSDSDSHRTAKGTCKSDNKNDDNLDSDSYDFSDFACKSYPYYTARPSGSKCHDGTKIHTEVGFEVETEFYKLLDICFDDILHTTLYVKATVVSGIAGYQQRFPRPIFRDDNFYPGLSVDNLYTTNTQRHTISSILGSTNLGDQYIDQTSDYYLARGHLAAKADFVYGSQQRTTSHFVNVAPQWQTFNKANWKTLENSVRTYADKNKVNLDVYTGTYGTLTLPNVNGNETELYLHVDSNNNKAIPVPKLFWKAVYDPKSQAGVVFVGINNPYVSNLQEDYIICNDVCSKISWLGWDQKNIKKGYSYCCDVGDFRRTVKTLPQFAVSGLLT